MPSLRNIIIHKREHHASGESSAQGTVSQFPPTSPPPPEITFSRSDTFGEEVITPPANPSDYDELQPASSPSRRSFQLFNRSPRSRSNSVSSSSPPHPRREHRLSNLLHLDHGRSRSNSRDSSANIPADLPQILDDQTSDKQEREAQWEKRAAVLVQHNAQLAAPSLTSPLQSEADLSLHVGSQPRSRSSSHSAVGDLREDVRVSLEMANVLLILYAADYYSGSYPVT